MKGEPQAYGNAAILFDGEVVGTEIVVFFDEVDELVEVMRFFDEVDPVHIYNEGLMYLALEVLAVHFLYIMQVIVRDVLLVFATPLADVVLQARYGCMQVYEQVGRGQVQVDDVKEFLEELVFLLLQVDACKEFTLGENIIGNDLLLKEILADKELLELGIPVGKEG